MLVRKNTVTFLQYRYAQVKKNKANAADHTGSIVVDPINIISQVNIVASWSTGLRNSFDKSLKVAKMFQHMLTNIKWL
jgi:uncharacterized protein YvpB